jgi:hypothetical protein
MRTAEGAAIDLVSLAGEICRRYHQEFPDEHARYGSAGHAWCLHDNQYLLAWSIQEVRDGTVDLVEQVIWLADVLGARGFPLARLARDLDIAAEVAGEAIDHRGLARGVANRLTSAATVVRVAASDDRNVGRPPRGG